MAIRRRQMQQPRAAHDGGGADADVVVVNPTHFAVALRYDGRKPAPEVVAKGLDLIAAAIRRSPRSMASRSCPTRRSRGRSTAEVEIGQMIPEELYHAVAEVLAFVYQLAPRGERRDGRRRACNRKRRARAASAGRRPSRGRREQGASHERGAHGSLRRQPTCSRRSPCVVVVMMIVVPLPSQLLDLAHHR